MRANLLIVSDLHIGEDLLPGASAEKQRAVALGAGAFCEFLRHHAQRRLDGRRREVVDVGEDAVGRARRAGPPVKARAGPTVKARADPTVIVKAGPTFIVGAGPTGSVVMY